MRYQTILIITLFLSTLAFSQSKIGTVNTGLILGKMPQTQTVLKRINNYAKELDSTFQGKTKAYSLKVEDYKKVEKTLSEEDKNRKIQELTEKQQEIAKFRENGAKIMQLKRDEYMRPLYKKINEVITEIAKSEGYTQVLTTDGNEFAYIDEQYDITKKVLAKLGIQE